MTEATLDVPDYEELQQMIQRAGLELEASEAHGIITGVLCGATTEEGRVRWVPVILAEHKENTASGEITAVSKMLVALHQHTLDQLKKMDFGFTLFLPEDGGSLANRVDALANWSAGFLTGLVAGGVQDIQSLPDEAADIAKDLLRISEVELDDAATDEQEDDLMQLEEYVRMGVQSIYIDIHNPKQVVNEDRHDA